MELGLSFALLAQPKTMAGNQGETPEVQADITISRRSQFHMAPEGFFFEVAVSGFDATGPAAGEVYDDRFHELYYFWDFGDAYTFTAPQNLPAAHKDANVAYGPMASHTYRASGNYTVAVLVVEPASGKQTTATLNVAIGDPDTLFVGSRTIFVSPSSAWGNAPAGATLATSFDTAVATVQGDDTIPKRIMLNRGETHMFTGTTLGQNPGQEWPTCHMVASAGADANPVVTLMGSFRWNDKQTTGNGSDKDFTIQNIDFEGPFDSTTNTGSLITPFGTFDNPPSLMLFDGCSFSGIGHAIYNDAGSSANVGHRATILNDTTITNFGEWGIADSDKTVLAITGCSIRAHVDALVDATTNMGAPVRTGGVDGLNLIHSSEFFSRQGWSAHGAYIATQPCIRLNSEGYEGSKCNVQASSFEGGFDVMAFTRANGSTASAGNVVIAKNTLAGGYQTNRLIVSDMGGMTVRNNICIQADSGRLPTTNNPSAFVGVANPDGDLINQASPINIYSNTLVNLLDGTNYIGADIAMAEILGAAAFTTVNVANNVLHQPNLTSPVISDAPLDGNATLWSPREVGYQSSSVPLQSQTATPPDTVASYAPLTGSAALGDALNEPVAYDDFYGEQRPQFPSRGALEMP